MPWRRRHDCASGQRRPRAARDRNLDRRRRRPAASRRRGRRNSLAPVEGARALQRKRLPGRRGERIVDGWCYTGDIGHLDADGFLYLKGRGTDLIRRGGLELFAPTIEAVLVAHPGVAEAAVVGLPVVGRGDEIVAFIVKRGEFAHDNIARHCRERLQPSQLPDRVFYLDALPRIPGGKVNRIRLLEAAAEQIEEQPKSRDTQLSVAVLPQG